MRKLVFQIAVSLDGYVEGTNGEMDWIERADDFEYANAFLSRFDTIFYGRVTYEKFGLPRRIEERATVAEREYMESINTMRKYVFSRKLKHVHGNGMMINGNAVSELKRLRDEVGKDIWLCGGPDLLKTLMDMSCVDEYIFAFQPVLLGSGKSLFRGPRMKVPLELIRSVTLNSGVAVLHYKTRNG